MLNVHIKTMFLQLFVTSASLVCAISGGMVVGFSAIFFPQINANKEFNFTADDESWIGRNLD